MHSFEWQKCWCHSGRGEFFAVTGDRLGEMIWGYKVGLGDLFMVMANLVMEAFCCHHFKEGVEGSLCRFEFVFCREEEETAYQFR
jgi:hypothetical protein